MDLAFPPGETVAVELSIEHPDFVTRSDTALAVVLGHTRWASVGIISQPNAHPVDSVEVTGDATELTGDLPVNMSGGVLSSLTNATSQAREVSAWGSSGGASPMLR